MCDRPLRQVSASSSQCEGLPQSTSTPPSPQTILTYAESPVPTLIPRPWARQTVIALLKVPSKPVAVLQVVQATQIFGSQKYGRAEVSWNWLQLMRCTYLQLCPGYIKWGLRIKVLECSGTEEAYQNHSEYEYKGERDGGAE